jgi:hypothetical protein
MGDRLCRRGARACAGLDVVAHAFDWPGSVTRTALVALLIGFPIAVTIAWYHGHRGLQRVSAGELAIVSALVLVGAVLFTFVLPKSTSGGVATSTAETNASSGAPAVAPLPADRQLLPNSVAVLPFENLSGDSDSDRYARGLHAAIITQLTKLSNIRVINRDSVLQLSQLRDASEGRERRRRRVGHGRLGDR